MQINLQQINGHFRYLNRRYLPYMFGPCKGYVRGYTPKYGFIWYSTSILGSWNSHWCISTKDPPKSRMTHLFPDRNRSSALAGALIMRTYHDIPRYYGLAKMFLTANNCLRLSAWNEPQWLSVIAVCRSLGVFYLVDKTIFICVDGFDRNQYHIFNKCIS